MASEQMMYTYHWCAVNQSVGSFMSFYSGFYVTSNQLCNPADFKLFRDHVKAEIGEQFCVTSLTLIGSRRREEAK